MARRGSFNSLITQIAREQARNQRHREQALARQEKERVKAQKEAIRLRALVDKEAKVRYIENRSNEVDDKNQDLREYIHEISAILEHTLSINDLISFESLRNHDQFRTFSPPKELTDPPKPLVDKKEYLSSIKPPNALEKLIPGATDRYQKALQEAEKKYNQYLEKYNAWLENRRMQLQKMQAEYNQAKEAFELKKAQQNNEVDEFEAAYKRGDPNAISAYCTMVLERSEYQDGFPQEFRVAYVPESKELVVEYELPNVDVIPMVSEYRYVKTRDVIEEKPHKPAEIKELYQDIVSSICLRTLHEVFEADQGNLIDVVVFNGFVQTIDPATGKDIRPHLISIRTTKNTFCNLDLRRIDKRACLRNLGAMVSPRPEEMQAVKPIVEFDMVDKRFVEESDIISNLESRPNLMDLSPFEFENLVSNLFNKMGLETKQTRSSKDGGVDAVAYDHRPVLGGKVVIQAKRYKNTVGVTFVRDLYGTMMNEGANKGILVSTSGYGPDAYEFAKDKPIELVDGGGLLYLLDQVGVKARIIFPED